MSQKPDDADQAKHPAEILLKSVRGDHAPTVADRERVRRALAQRLAQSAPLSGPDVSASALSPWLKLGFGLLLATGAALVAVHYSHSSRPAADSGEMQPSAAAPASPEAAPSDSAPHSAPAPRAAIERSTAATRVARERNARTANPSREVASRRVGKGQAPSAIAPLDVAPQAPAPRADVEAEAASGPTLGERTVSSVTRAAAADKPAELRDDSEVGSKSAPHSASVKAVRENPAKPANAELAFLKQIQASLQAGDPKEVLELSSEHARRWPHGMFVQEREGLRAIAACQVHAPDAIGGARKFSTAYPQSPMLTRVRAACPPPTAAKPTR